MPETALFDPVPLPVKPCRVGESPFWHPVERALYWCDIPARTLHRFDPMQSDHQAWTFDSELACCAPILGGGLLLAMRDGLWTFDRASGERTLLCDPPYDRTHERFNDGKVDAQGQFWVGTLYEPRDKPAAALYRWTKGVLERMAGGVTNSNGLAWSPDGRTLYWSDTSAHCVMALDVSATEGTLSNRRVFHQFPRKNADMPLENYGGRPDGAAVDSEGCYWAAMFEGQRLVRLSPEGQLLQEVLLPVRCPTMPCFGDDDLRTIYLTTARDNRPDEEVSRQPWAGAVLRIRVEVPGLPVAFAL
jgi:sugar lactone lactonase YvrE